MSLKSLKRTSIFAGLSLALFSQFAMAVSITPTLANAMVNRAYPITNLVTSGVSPYVVTVAGVPAGMTVSADGFISGTPTTVGTYTLNVSATDSTNASVSGDISITVDPEPVVSGAGIVTGTGFNSIVVNGGLVPTNVNIAISDDTVIDFLNGTTYFTLAGKFITYTGTVDALGVVHATNIVVDVAPPAVTFIASLLNGKVGVAYTSISLMATGIAPHSVTATGVPAGMVVSSTGVLSGTPTATGTYNIALSARDSAGTLGTGTVSITIDPADVVTPPSVCGNDDDDYHQGHGNNGNHYGWWNGYGNRDDDKDHNSRSKNKKGNQTQTQKVEGEGKITAVTATAITVKNILIRITDETEIDLKKNVTALKVGMKVEYEGVKNADGSITACEIEQD